MSSKEGQSPTVPAGQGKGAGLAMLERGANLFQGTAPLKDFDVYVVGFHPAMDDPRMQMEAHHYCRVVNDDFIQDDSDASLKGTVTVRPSGDCDARSVRSGQRRRSVGVGCVGR